MSLVSQTFYVQLNILFLIAEFILLFIIIINTNPTITNIITSIITSIIISIITLFTNLHCDTPWKTVRAFRQTMCLGTRSSSQRAMLKQRIFIVIHYVVTETPHWDWFIKYFHRVPFVVATLWERCTY